jgi:hypothetical protein
MIYASDFRKGITFEINGEPHVVIDFQHVKPGKGAAFVRTKYRNVLNGTTREEAFNPNDKPKQYVNTKKSSINEINDETLSNILNMINNKTSIKKIYATSFENLLYLASKLLVKTLFIFHLQSFNIFFYISLEITKNYF